jgi:hypothetical protein
VGLLPWKLHRRRPKGKQMDKKQCVDIFMI